MLLRYFKWCVSCLTVLIIMFTLIILIGFKYLLSSQERSEKKSVLFIKLRSICDRGDRRAFILLEGLICPSYLVSTWCFQTKMQRLFSVSQCQIVKTESYAINIIGFHMTSLRFKLLSRCIRAAENYFSYKFSLQKGSWFCDRVRLNF